MSGIHFESERGNDETSHAIFVHEVIRGNMRQRIAREIRGKVGTVMWGQRIGPQGKVKI
jgi:hypothetical protein